MQSCLEENFDVIVKHSSDEAFQRWRRINALVKKPGLTFRSTVPLSKRDETAAMHRTNQVTPSQVNSNNKLWGVFLAKKKVVSKYTLILANLILEILLVIFDQLASPHKPKYALLALMVSLTAMVICVGEIIYKGQRKNGRGFMYWLCHPFSNDCPYTFIDAFCTAAAVSQVVFSSIAYSYLHQGGQNPVKVSISALIFIVCYGCSRLVNRQHDTQLPVTGQAA